MIWRPTTLVMAAGASFSSSAAWIDSSGVGYGASLPCHVLLQICLPKHTHHEGQRLVGLDLDGGIDRILHLLLRCGQAHAGDACVGQRRARRCGARITANSRTCRLCLSRYSCAEQSKVAMHWFVRGRGGPGAARSMHRPPYLHSGHFDAVCAAQQAARAAQSWCSTMAAKTQGLNFGCGEAGQATEGTSGASGAEAQMWGASHCVHTPAPPHSRRSAQLSKHSISGSRATAQFSQRACSWSACERSSRSCTRVAT